MCRRRQRRQVTGRPVQAGDEEAGSIPHPEGGALMPQSLASADTIPLRLATLDQALGRFEPAVIGTRRLSPDVADYILHRAEGIRWTAQCALSCTWTTAPRVRHKSAFFLKLSAPIFTCSPIGSGTNGTKSFGPGGNSSSLAFSPMPSARSFCGSTSKRLKIRRFTVLRRTVPSFSPGSWSGGRRRFSSTTGPIRKRRKLFDRIAAAPVSIAPGP